jgi:glycosyltransferase involved in cell wall biosynthesis
VADRLRLVLSSHTFLPTVGGAELGVHELAKRLGERHEVIVLAPGDPAASVDYRPQDYRVMRVTRPRRGRRTIAGRLSELTGWAYARALVRLQRARPVDAVNPHFVRRHGLLVVVARALGIRVVLSLVGRTDVVALLSRPRRIGTELVIRAADAVVANSSYYLRGSALADRAHIVPYGVDLDRFVPGLDRAAARLRIGLDPADFVCLAVQRLEPLKRVDQLIRVLAVLRRELPAARLLVCGTGTDAARLQRLAGELGVELAVIFAGYVSESDLPTMYGLSDAFVSHSEAETFGVTFAEAMAAGLPVVAADTSCIRDVLAPDTATIVRPDDIEGFAAAVNELAREPGTARRRGGRGRLRAEREFDWDAIARRYEHLMAGPSDRSVEPGALSRVSHDPRDAGG